MAESAQSSSGSKLVWLLVLALLGAVWWLASERNARKFTYEVKGGELLVSKGRYFPTGFSSIGAADAQGKVYAGIAPPAGTKAVAETEFDDQVSLDRALYDLITGWTRAAALKKDAAAQQQAEELVTRLSALTGLTPAQLGDLQGLRAELGWWSAGRDLEAAVKQLAIARRKLEEVRRGDVDHAAQAGAMLGPLDALSLQLTELAAGRGGPAAPAPASLAPPATSSPSVTPVRPAAALPASATAPPAVAAPLVPATPPAGAGSGSGPHAAAPVSTPATEAEPKGSGSAAHPKGRASAPNSVPSGAPR